MWFLHTHFNFNILPLYDLCHVSLSRIYTHISADHNIPGDSSEIYEEVNANSRPTAALTNSTKKPIQKLEADIEVHDKPRENKTHDHEIPISTGNSYQLTTDIVLVDRDESSSSEHVYGNIGESNTNPIQLSELFTCVQRMKTDGEISKEFKVRFRNKSFLLPFKQGDAPSSWLLVRPFNYLESMWND